MKHILFVGTWIGAGQSMLDAVRPQARELWQANGVQWSNLRDTGQTNVKPNPNLCVWECDAVVEAGVALLEANPNDYQILICEEVA